MSDCLKAIVAHIEALVGVDLQTREGWTLLALMCGLVYVAAQAQNKFLPLALIAALIYVFSDFRLMAWHTVLPRGGQLVTPQWPDRDAIAAITLRRQNYQIHGLDRTTVFRKHLALKSWLLFRGMTSYSLVAADRDSGRVVGVLSYGGTEIDATALSIGIDVHPEFRQRGIGRELLAAGIHLAHRKGWQSVWVGTSKHNAGMRKIMDDLGIVPARSELHTLPNGRRLASFWYECKPGPEIKATLGLTDDKERLASAG